VYHAKCRELSWTPANIASHFGHPNAEACRRELTRGLGERIDELFRQPYERLRDLVAAALRPSMRGIPLKQLVRRFVQGTLAEGGA